VRRRVEATVNISESFGFNVPPEMVFDSLTDPVAAERFLPHGASVKRLDEQRLRVVVGTGELPVVSGSGGTRCRNGVVGEV